MRERERERETESRAGREGEARGEPGMVSLARGELTWRCTKEEAMWAAARAMLAGFHPPGVWTFSPETKQRKEFETMKKKRLCYV